MIVSPGIYPDIPASVYHADPAPNPSLSCSILERLLERTPAHAYAAHPRLTKQEPEEFKHNLGTVVHELLLGGGGLIVIDADSWRGKEAQGARDAALRDGQTPVLRHHYEEAMQIFERILLQMEQHPDLKGLLEVAIPEASAFWQEPSGFWCRCRPDLAMEDLLVDLKVTGVAATPEAWGAGHAMRMGYARRACFYRRGWRAVANVMPRYRFAVIENHPPYALSVFECSPEALDIGVREVAAGMAIWERCMRTNEWPAYPREIQWINPPVWAQYRSEEVLARHAFSQPQDEAQAPFVMGPEGFGV
jgi:hypothetical protein